MNFEKVCIKKTQPYLTRPWILREFVLRRKCLAPKLFLGFLMIASITWNSNLVPLLEGLCTSNPCRFGFSVFWVLPESNRQPQDWQSRALANWASFTSTRMNHRVSNTQLSFHQVVHTPKISQNTVCWTSVRWCWSTLSDPSLSQNKATHSHGWKLSPKSYDADQNLSTAVAHSPEALFVD